MANNPALTTRLTFPEDRTTFVYGPPNTPIRTPPRTGLRIFLDEECTQAANILTPAGTPIAHSTIYTEPDSLLPEFVGPPGFVVRLYAKVVGGTQESYPLMAQYSDQIANLPVLLSGEGPPPDDLGAVNSFYIDKGTSTDPNEPDNPVVYGPRTVDGWPDEGTPLRGPQGEPGQTDIWIQTNPSDEWLISHHLTILPNVSTLNSAGEVIYGEVIYPLNDPHKIIVRFGAPESGRAILT